MNIQRCVKGSFSVIGKLGSTNDGDGFIQRLWADANVHYGEISDLAKTDDNGNPVGFWGAMSDMSSAFKPWEEGFTKGLYLAGAEVRDHEEAPDGWTKWTIPAYEYLYVKVEDGAQNTFPAMIKYMEENNLKLAGAVNDFICPEENGQPYMFFPIRRV